MPKKYSASLKYKVLRLVIIGLATCNFGLSTIFAQKIAINATGNPPHASAILDIDATGMSPKAGILLPRMTTAQRNAIPSPAQSLTIYNTTTNTLDFYNGSSWKAYTSALASAVVAGGTGPGVGVAFNTTGSTAHPSAMLDVSSTTQGLLLPRTTESAIVSPTEGLFFFSTQSLGMRYYDGSNWKTNTCETVGVAGAGGTQTAIGSGINASGADAHHSAVIDLSSTTLGFKLPKLNDAERNAIPSPAQGLLFYNTTSKRVEFFNGTEWRYIIIGGGFKTEWATSSPGETITLPLLNTGSLVFNCIVYWGDGSSSQITAENDPDRVHTYTTAGTYTVEIIGQCEGWSFSNGGDKLKIRKILSWGEPCGFNGFKFLGSGFYGCTNLTYLPPTGGILASGSGCGSFQQTFRNCSGLSSVPSDLFRYHIAVNDNAFSSTFKGCVNLTGTIPSDLFRYNINAQSNAFYETFYDCYNLTGSIPTDLFRYNTLVWGSVFHSTFYNCYGLSGAIPSDLFKYNTGVSSAGFYKTFMYCSSLTGAIPVNLFSNNTNVSDNGFNSTFWQCTGLTSIPSDLFKFNTLVSYDGFKETFRYCSGLTGSIPTDLFKFNTLVSNCAFFCTFNGCTNLSGSIPVDLFKYNTLVTGETFLGAFNSTFHGCSGLTGTIPAELFKYNINVNKYAFNSTFRNCSGLTGGIPLDLFRYNTLASTNAFVSTFEGCSGLTSIPIDLFRYNTLITTFLGTFTGCSGLTSIPVDLFRYNTSATEFWSTFQGCYNLTSVPVLLFKYNTNANSFYRTFYGCNKLQLNRNIFFADGEEASRFLNKTVSFQQCFYRTSFTGTMGEAPPLWSCSFGTGSSTKTSCFGGAGNSVSSLSNYASIPVAWK